MSLASPNCARSKTSGNFDDFCACFDTKNSVKYNRNPKLLQNFILIIMSIVVMTSNYSPVSSEMISIVSVLSEETKRCVTSTIKEGFQRYSFCDDVIMPCLPRIYADFGRVPLDHRGFRHLADRYFDLSHYKREDNKAILEVIPRAVYACYVAIMSHLPDKKDYLFTSVPQLLHSYPEFQNLEEQELRYLLTFRNMMRLAIEIIPPRLHKKLLLKVAAHLEGSGREYITGGGQKMGVTRRVMIYEREGNIQPEKRPKRDDEQDRVSGRKRKGMCDNKILTMHASKLVRYSSDDVSAMLKDPAMVDVGLMHPRRAGQVLPLPKASAFTPRTSALPFLAIPKEAFASKKTALENPYTCLIFDELMGFDPARPDLFYSSLPEILKPMSLKPSFTAPTCTDATGFFDPMMGISTFPSQPTVVVGGSKGEHPQGVMDMYRCESSYPAITAPASGFISREQSSMNPDEFLKYLDAIEDSWVSKFNDSRSCSEFVFAREGDLFV